MRAAFAHTPWDGSHPLFRIGLAPLGDAALLEPDALAPAHLAEKRRLLDERFGDVFAAEADTLAAQAEVLAMISALAGGLSAPAEGLLPIVQAALMVQEDLVLMRKGESGWRIAAACVCFPSSWNVRDKVGRPMHEVHSPGPGFGAGTRNAMMIERIFDHLQPGEPVMRMNWSLYPDDRLFHGQERSDRPRSGEIGEIFLRVERQTLTKLPVSGDILFTIRIHVDPVSAIGSHPESARLAAGLAASLRRLGAEEAAYKSLTHTRERMLEQLDAMAARS